MMEINNKYTLPKRHSMLKKILLVLAVTAILPIIISIFIGYSEKTHDVEYYLTHPDERREKLIECSKNPGENFNQPNCINADSAEAKAIFKINGAPQIK